MMGHHVVKQIVSRIRLGTSRCFGGQYVAGVSEIEKVLESPSYCLHSVS